MSITVAPRQKIEGERPLVAIHTVYVLQKTGVFGSNEPVAPNTLALDEGLPMVFTDVASAMQHRRSLPEHELWSVIPRDVWERVA